MQNLTGKVAIVTGASQGIGRAIAKRLYADGANVVLSYLPEHGTGEVIQQIGANSERALAVAGDLRRIDFVKRLFEEATDRFGGLDIVVANAGVNMNKPVVDTTEEDFERIFSVNIRGTFFVFQEAARQIRDSGRIVGISSNMTLQGTPWHCVIRSEQGRGRTIRQNSRQGTRPAQCHGKRRCARPYGYRNGLATLPRHGSRHHAPWPARPTARHRGRDCVSRFGRRPMGDRADYRRQRRHCLTNLPRPMHAIPGPTSSRMYRRHSLGLVLP